MKKNVKVGGAVVTVKGLIAEGANGFVYQGFTFTRSGGGRRPAAKVALKKILCLDESGSRSAKREIDALSRFRHKNIVELLLWSVVENNSDRSDENYPHPYALLVFPYCESSLESRVSNRGRLSCESALSVLRGICSAASFLHSRGCRHNDIKPGNVLLRGSGGGDGEPILTDFGSCGDCEELVADRRQALAAMDFYSRSTTAPYRAPELWDIPSGAALTHKADAFSAG